MQISEGRIRCDKGSGQFIDYLIYQARVRRWAGHPRYDLEGLLRQPHQSVRTGFDLATECQGHRKLPLRIEFSGNELAFMKGPVLSTIV